VNRTGNVTLPAALGYAVAGGSAAAGSDYTGGTGTLSFAPGAASASFNLTMVDNNTYEGNETVVVSLGSPVNVTIGANASATVTIAEDDAPPSIQFSPATYTAGESAGNLTVRAVLTGSTALPASVTCAVAGGNATQGIDYAGGTGTLSFPTGTSVASINLSIADDTAFEGNETVTLALSSPVNAIPGASTTATATIVNDDPEPEVIAFNLSINEGWNLVSVPLTPANTSITSVIPSESMSCVQIIWYYDNTDPGAPAWKYFKPGRLTNTLTDVTDGMGFWICANSSFNFTVTGTLPLDNNVTIRNGWNMVGPKGLSSQAPADVYGDYYLTWGFTDNMWYYYKPSRPTNTLTQVEPGRGYWIYQP
jgi:hypothetical protein